LARIAEGEEGCLGIDLEDGDAAAAIADEPLGRVVRAAEGDLDVARFTAYGVGGVNRAVGIDEKNPCRRGIHAGRPPQCARPLTAFLENALHLVLQGLKRRTWLSIRATAGTPPSHPPTTAKSSSQRCS